jgi:hypothetical protein
MKQSDICRTMLRILADADGHPLSEDVMLEHVGARLRPVPPRAALDDALITLKSGGHIKAREGDFGDEEPKWLITEKGETWLDR